QLTRKELYSTLENAGISTAANTVHGSRGLHIVGWLAREGIICFGPRKGKQPTFVLLEEWVPKPRKLVGEQAIAELTSRYFRGHGPASVRDFAWWSGLTMSEINTGIELVKSELASETFAGKTYWFDPGNHVDEGIETAHFLPNYDEYTVGYADREELIDNSDIPRLDSRGNSVFVNVAILDGRIVGTWQRKITRKSVELTLLPIRALGTTSRALLDTAARRYGQFHQLPVECHVTELPSRA
ncbi:MAG: AlkZ family DNA glycosylase, partial [Sciscionella sp.]|nr:AlkZ family DNA glycosylase [Sciscionella sp.]